jgi:nucleoside-diphosphate-sugar epimerase
MISLNGKRLVIFGCGYLGTEVARVAVAAGLRVDALTRNPTRASELQLAGVNAVVADLASSDWHGRIAADADLVLNCVSSGNAGFEGYRQSYVAGMRSILGWARRGRAGTFVYTSSTSVYPQTGGAVIDESAPTDGAGETGRILLESESLLREARDACDRWFILRLAGIYGPGRHHLLDQIRAGVAEIGGNGGHRLNLAHRDDIEAAVMAAFGAPGDVRDLVLNVADDAPATKAEVVQWLAVETGLPAPRFSGAPASRRHGFADPPDRTISNARIKTVLGWRPRYPSFREGYAAIIA